MDLARLSLTESLKKRLGLISPQIGALSSVSKLMGDASTRTFLRLFFQSGDTGIAMCYPDESIADIATFVDVQNYLTDLDLPAPHILRRFDELGILVLEDLGDDLLETAVQNVSQVLRNKLYNDAVDLVINLLLTTNRSPLRCGAHDLAFDFEKLSFEMDFFIKHFVFGFLKSDLDHRTENELRSKLFSVCNTLAKEPRFFVHRDYHARNLMLHKHKLFMIDFQDARMGPIQYDLASLLRDSYVTLPSSISESLIQKFFEATRQLSKQSPERFRLIFDLMALQRNIKALGTFGYQTTVVGTDRYRSSISRTVSYIEENLSSPSQPVMNPDIIIDLVVTPARMAMTG